MATTKELNSSEMTGEAYELLDCFASGIDDLVYKIAEGIAASKEQRSPEGAISITAADVKQAAESIFNAISAQAGKSIPQSVASEIQSMHECVLAKCRAK